jgi:hypothetical protein
MDPPRENCLSYHFDPVSPKIKWSIRTTANIPSLCRKDGGIQSLRNVYKKQKKSGLFHLTEYGGRSFLPHVGKFLLKYMASHSIR